MRLVSFYGGFGRVEGDSVVPMGPSLRAYLEGAPEQAGEPQRLEALTLAAPVPDPKKIVCVGLNYVDHATESSLEIPKEPLLFGKYQNSVVGPGQAIVVPPAAASQVDYEAELGVIIGRQAHRVSEREALSYVAGYCCANDISARDLQVENGQWHRGKAIDTFLPLGPHLVTADEVPDPQALRITCDVNGRRMQEASTADMIFNVAELISFISQTMTLEPGDVICTGTPPGVGFHRSPRVRLTEGDEVTVAISSVGRLSNTVTMEI